MHTEKKGILGEWIATLVLFCKGFRILERRYKTTCGEIDIIAKRLNLIVFVEVKFRQDEEKCFNAITDKQLKRVQRASEIFINRHSEYQNNFRRYDVILINKWKLPIHIENVSIDHAIC